MIFCSECFKDSQIRDIINSQKKRGKCEVCGLNNVFIYDTLKDNYLDGFFDDLISIYTVRSLLPDDYPASDVHMLSDELKNEWNIFNDSLSSSTIHNITVAISPRLYKENPELFDSPIGVKEKYDKEELYDLSIMKDKTWNDFVESIKHKNRFHTQIIDLKKLETYLSYLCKNYSKGTLLYRGRLCSDSKGYAKRFMGAPPVECAKEGRANSVGISRLYVADCEKTCIHEIRAGALDRISIGTFKLKSDIAVIDFKQISTFSPFSSEDFNFLEYLINKPILKKIDEEMSKNVRANDNSLDYVPTQFLCDFIATMTYRKDEKFQGVEYSSTLYSKGYNLAIFNPDLFVCTDVKTYQINNLEYDYK